MSPLTGLRIDLNSVAINIPPLTGLNPTDYYFALRASSMAALSVS